VTAAVYGNLYSGAYAGAYKMPAMESQHGVQEQARRARPQIGDRVRFGGRTWRVITVFPSEFDGEWGMTLRRPARAPSWWPWRVSTIAHVKHVQILGDKS
jgi:hypothetical protein